MRARIVCVWVSLAAGLSHCSRARDARNTQLAAESLESTVALVDHDIAHVTEALPRAATTLRSRLRIPSDQARAAPSRRESLPAPAASSAPSRLSATRPIGGLPLTTQAFDSAHGRNGQTETTATPDLAAQARAALRRIRTDVPGLGTVASTFFAFATSDGVALCNDIEPDVMAGANLFQAYPMLARIASPPPSDAGHAREVVATQGRFASDLQRARPDKEWVTATAVGNENEPVVGILVTGWTYRHFAYHLEESLKRDMRIRKQNVHGSNNEPLTYVFVFDEDGVFGARNTPRFNELELAKRNLVDATKNGPVRAPVTLDGRTFGYAAQRIPALGVNAGVVVLASET